MNPEFLKIGRTWLFFLIAMSSVTAVTLYSMSQGTHISIVEPMFTELLKWLFLATVGGKTVEKAVNAFTNKKGESKR